MKNALFLLLAIFVGAAFSTNANAQKAITDGSIVYEIKAEGGTDPQIGMINGSTIAMHFKGEQSKIAANLMGGMIAMNMITDSKAKKGLMLMDMMGQKKAVKLDSKPFDEAKSKGANKLELTRHSETKTIAGYACKKATMKTPDGNEIVLYLCDNIKPKGNLVTDQLLGAMDGGFPLGFEMEQAGARITILAKEVNAKAPSKSEFKMAIPDGYTEAKPEEFGGMPFGGGN